MTAIIYPGFRANEPSDSGRAVVVAENNATIRSAIGVYSTTEVDGIIAGLTALQAEDIDTLAEINLILGDAALASVSYVDGLAGNYATAAQGVKADTALQPSAITSGSITPGTGDIDFSKLGGSAWDGNAFFFPEGSSTARVFSNGSYWIFMFGSGQNFDIGLGVEGIEVKQDMFFGWSANHVANGSAADTRLHKVSPGVVGVSGSSSDASGTLQAGTLEATAPTSTVTPLTIKGAPSQTANLLEVLDSSDDTLVSINSSGQIVASKLGDAGSSVSIYSSFAFTFHFGGTPALSLHSNLGLRLKKELRFGWTSGIHATQGTAGLGFEWVDNETTRLSQGIGGNRGNLEIGTLNLSNLPISDPLVAGDIWNDSGTLKISAG